MASSIPAGLPPIEDRAPGWRRAWLDSIGSPRLWGAPMVGQSECAWRTVAREYGMQAGWTPMVLAKMFMGANPIYSDDVATTHAGDRPLIAQLAGDDIETLQAAARQLAPYVDALDINFGCPQPIAKRGGYGAFLLEDRDLVLRIVHALAHDPSISVPVCAKIRVLDDRDATVELAIAIAEAGAAMLTVHGRTRMEKKQDCRHADWDTIARIRAALPHVPVLANGGIHHAYDFARCMATTGVEGVLSSEAALESPGMWSGGIHWPTGRVHTQLEMAHRYIQVSFQLHTLYATVRSHTLKILQGALTEHVDLRDRAVDIGVQFEGLHAVVQELASRFGVALPGLHDPAPVGRALDPSKLLQFRTVSGEATIEPTNAQAWLAEHSSMGDVGSDAITQCHAIWRTLCPQAAAFCLTGPGKPATPGHAPDYSQAIGPAFRGGHLAGAWIGDRLVLHKGTVAAPHMKHVMKSARRAFKRHHVNTRILEEMRISVEPEVPAIPQPVPVPAGTRCVLPPVAPRAGDAAPSTPDQQATLLHMTSGPPHQQAAWLATWAPPLQFPQAGRWYWRHHKHVLAGEMEASREHTW